VVEVLVSVVKIYSINCDLPPADHPQTQHASTCPGWVSQALTITEARQEARAAGWLQRRNKDYCPAAQEMVKP
jgi:hypothetical protein